MHDFPIAQIDNPVSGWLDDLYRATSSAQATHLEEIQDMKEIRGRASRLRYVFDRFQQPFAVDRFRKHLRFRDLELLCRGGIGREEKRLQSRKNFTERATEDETIDRGPIELRQQKSA